MDSWMNPLLGYFFFVIMIWRTWPEEKRIGQWRLLALNARAPFLWMAKKPRIFFLIRFGKFEEPLLGKEEKKPNPRRSFRFIPWMKQLQIFMKTMGPFVFIHAERMNSMSNRTLLIKIPLDNIVTVGYTRFHFHHSLPLKGIFRSFCSSIWIGQFRALVECMNVRAALPEPLQMIDQSSIIAHNRTFEGPTSIIPSASPEIVANFFNFIAFPAGGSSWAAESLADTWVAATRTGSVGGCKAENRQHDQIERQM